MLETCLKLSEMCPEIDVWAELPFADVWFQEVEMVQLFSRFHAFCVGVVVVVVVVVICREG